MERRETPSTESISTLSRWVVTDDTAGLIDFLTRAYDGVELSRVATEDGRIGHAEIRIGDAVVLAFDRSPDREGPRPVRQPLVANHPRGGCGRV